MDNTSGTDPQISWPSPSADFEDYEGQQPTQKSRIKKFVALGVVLVFVFTVFYTNIGAYFDSQLPDTAQIDAPTRQDVLQGIKDSELYVLDTDNIVTHIHAHLTIVVQGKPVVVPVIGVDMDTLTAAPIHTHDASGTLHIETDATNSYAPNALDFVRLWKKGADNLCLIFTSNAKCKVAVSINGNIASIDDVLRDKDRMLIRVSLPDKPVYA